MVSKTITDAERDYWQFRGITDDGAGYRLISPPMLLMTLMIYSGKRYLARGMVRPPLHTTNDQLLTQFWHGFQS